MKRFFQALKRFFFPPSDTKVILRILPFITVAFLVILFFAIANYAWEESNSTSFCGLTCHTMPPEYITHQDSVHAVVSCEDCHMGRDRLYVMIGRKVRYSWQTGTAMLFNTYEYPIVAKNMAPARQACENCHKPETFSKDSLVEIKHYADDAANTLTYTYLVVKTGGGTSREGLGYGIHWHIENPVFYYATDREQQDIPYVVVENKDGTRSEYVDVESDFDPASVSSGQLVQMDCITCHNRTAHRIENPQSLVDSLLARGQISADIPGIKKKAVEIFSVSYPSEKEALDAIASLEQFYQNSQADMEQVKSAIATLQTAYQRTHFPDQKVDWQTHPDNAQHVDSPGCFRCHDGKHLTKDNEAIRLECNLCHSIPVVSAQNEFITRLEISRGPEPSSHQDSNWINRHRSVFDESCSGCHTVDDAGGVSNTSFCSNSACHGASWKFAGFDAPKVREILGLNATPTPAPTPVPAEDEETVEEPAPAASNPTYEKDVASLLKKCSGCHGSSGQKGVNLTSYASIMSGGEEGALVVPGNPEQSLLVTAQSQAKPHFMQLSASELQTIIDWIKAGAPEK